MSKNEKIVCDICECDDVEIREDTVDLCRKCYRMISVVSAEGMEVFNIEEVTHGIC